jgi:hypothetical protein
MTNNSYLNIITFLLTTIFYYVSLKPKLSYDTLNNTESFQKYKTNNYIYLVIYFLLVLFIQYIINIFVLVNKCGGNMTDNVGYSALFTFIPWIFIFGVMIFVLVLYPSFKNVFSDVIGYFYVSNSANKILTELLMDKNLQKDEISTAEQKSAITASSDMILKIYGNTSLLINQIIPSNFNEYWNILKPLMKPKYQVDGAETQNIRNEFFNLVVLRDNIGESMWYVYTGLLLTSIVQMKITTKGCSRNSATMAKNYKSFLEKEEVTKKEQEKKTDVIYTIN